MKEIDSLKEALETENKLKEDGGQCKGGQVLRKWRKKTSIMLHGS